MKLQSLIVSTDNLERWQQEHGQMKGALQAIAGFEDKELSADIAEIMRGIAAAALAPIPSSNG